MRAPDLAAPAALRACIQQAVRRANWLVGIFAGSAAMVVFESEWHALGPWIVIGASVAGSALGIRLGIRSAARFAASMPAADAAVVLGSFARHDDEVARQVATALLKRLPTAGSELVAAGAPLSERGDEPLPAG